MLRANIEAEIQANQMQLDQVEKDIKRVKAILQSMEYQLSGLRVNRDYIKSKIEDLEDELNDEQSS